MAALRLPSRTVAAGPTCGAQVAAVMIGSPDRRNACRCRARTGSSVYRVVRICRRERSCAAGTPVRVTGAVRSCQAIYDDAWSSACACFGRRASRAGARLRRRGESWKSWGCGATPSGLARRAAGVGPLRGRRAGGRPALGIRDVRTGRILTARRRSELLGAAASCEGELPVITPLMAVPPPGRGRVPTVCCRGG